MDEFSGFTNAQSGKRTKYLMAAAFKMKRGGMSHKQITTHTYKLNDMLLFPKSKKEVKRRVLDYIQHQ